MSEEFDFASVGGIRAFSGSGEPFWDFGWASEIAPPQASVFSQLQTYPTADLTPACNVFDDSLPKQVFLWQVQQKVTGNQPPTKNQGNLGSCVSFGTNTAIERTMACQIFIDGKPEQFKFIVEEATYGGSRVEVGRGRIRGDGSVGAWAAEFVRRWGVLAREVILGHDLTTYSTARGKQWGDRGVPDELEPIARNHPVKETTLVRTWADAKKMLASGYGIAICSMQGFTMRRDSNGVCQPSGQWAHCMALDGYIVLDNGQEYGHIDNSWGPNAHTGPVGWGDPPTSGFWSASSVADRMLRAGDSWAFSALNGFPARKIQWSKVL